MTIDTTERLLEDVPEDYAFRLQDKSLKNLKTLTQHLSLLNEAVFSQHVNEQKNDFYNWVRDVYKHKEFSSELVDCSTKEAVLQCVQKWIQNAEKTRNERKVLEQVVKTKVKELMEPDTFNPQKWMDPLSFPDQKIKKPEPLPSTPNIPFTNPLKKLGQEHPKNIRNATPVPKLWELKPLKKVERNIELKRPLIKQIKLTEVAPPPKKENTTKTQERLPLEALMPQQPLIKSRKVNASSASEMVEKLKEVYKLEI